ncbi:hypothetical protein LLH00_16430 [bacterium]|nr:hypothetical protein [bacterium]
MMQVTDSQNSLPEWAKTKSGIEDVENKGKTSKDDFLKLLVTQLQNQDPLNPADNQEFSAQLAQFSSLEQLTEMNDTLSKNLEGTTALGKFINNSVAAGFIGREINAVGDQVLFDGENETTIQFHLENTSSETTVHIYDSTGAEVRSLDLSGQPKGGSEVAWDGKDDQGDTCNEGIYYVKVEATDSEGQTVDATTFMSGRVTGVRYVDNQPFLMLGEKMVSLENVFDVLDPGSLE